MAAYEAWYTTAHMAIKGANNGSGTNSCVWDVFRDSDGADIGDQSASYTNLGPTECPPGPCDDKQGEYVAGGRVGLLEAIESGGCVGMCAVSGTYATRISGGSDGASTPSIVVGMYTGQQCDAEPSLQPADCFVLSGKSYCVERESPSDPGSAWAASINSDYIGPQGLSGCKSFASGGVACVVSGDGSTSPENLPNNGDEGNPQAAQPDGVIQYGDQVINYYTASTVSNSTSVVNTGDGSGTGSGSDSGDGDPGGSPGEIGDAIGDGGAGPGTSEVDVGGLAETGVIGVGGSCPEPPEIEVLGVTFELPMIDYLCMFAERMSGLVMIVAYLSAAWIVVGTAFRS
jgi:hypothetical protein